MTGHFGSVGHTFLPFPSLVWSCLVRQFPCFYACVYGTHRENLWALYKFHHNLKCESTFLHLHLNIRLSIPASAVEQEEIH